MILVSLSKDVFERSTLTGSGLFAFLSSGLAHFLRQIVSIRVRTLSNSNLVVPSYIKEIGPHFRLTRVTPKRPESNELRRRARKNRHPRGKWQSYHLPREWQFSHALTQFTFSGPCKGEILFPIANDWHTYLLDVLRILYLSLAMAPDGARITSCQWRYKDVNW